MAGFGADRAFNPDSEGFDSLASRHNKEEEEYGHE